MRTNITTLLSRAVLALSVFLMTATSAWGYCKHYIGGTICQETTENDAYLIKTLDDLKNLAVYINGGTYVNGTKNDVPHKASYDKFIQTADINANGASIIIGSDMTNYFDGKYDGNDKTISNLKINMTSKNNLGLFGVIGRNGSVTNLTLSRASVTGTFSSVGGFAGSNYGTISNCTIKNSTITGSSEVGGIAGGNYGTISNNTADNNTVESTGAANLHGGVGGIADV